MNYHEFVRIVEKEINRNLKGGMKARLYTTIKNNNQKKIGIIVEKPGVNISPTIYLEEYYSLYHKGMEIEEILESILFTYENIKCEKSWNVDFLNKYEKVQNKIVFKVVNTQKNKGFLDRIPHINFLDLSIVFYVLLDSNMDGTATMVIQNDTLKQWGIGIQELLMASAKNMRKLLPPRLFSMKSVIEEIIDPFTAEQENIFDSGKGYDANGMYILSNSIRSFGAACMVYPGILKAVGEILDSDYYLLPSSVHEVILVAKRNEMNIAQMTEMVKEVNREQVAAEEVLSDHAYFYSRKKGKLLTAEF